MKENIEVEIEVCIDESVEVDETQFSRIVNMINKVGIEKFRRDFYLSGETAEELAREHCQSVMNDNLDFHLWRMDETFVDDHVISEIQDHYTDELDENKN